MKLRGYLGVSLMLTCVVWLPFLAVYMLITMFTEGYTIRQAFDYGFVVSVAFAVLYGFWMGFYYRCASLRLPIQTGTDILEKLMLEMAKLGYHPENKVENIITFAPNIFGGKAAGNISAMLKENEMVITGACFHLGRLKKALKNK